MRPDALGTSHMRAEVLWWCFAASTKRGQLKPPSTAVGSLSKKAYALHFQGGQYGAHVTRWSVIEEYRQLCTRKGGCSGIDLVRSVFRSPAVIALLAGGSEFRDAHMEKAGPDPICPLQNQSNHVDTLITCHSPCTCSTAQRVYDWNFGGQANTQCLPHLPCSS
jgi:hypothetical protein